ncbi:MAG: hypothetical protein Q8877_03445 [Sweet potato little leaf phytoplasma]|nr:hypothetical protein [Sweet potato little leaf phytoplasma]
MQTEIIKFLMVDCLSTYNAILGRPCLQAFGAVVSTVHLAMMFVGTDDKVVTVQAEQATSCLCYNASLGKIKSKDIKKLEKPSLGKGSVLLADLDVRAEEDESRPTPKGEWEYIPLGDHLNH